MKQRLDKGRRELKYYIPPSHISKVLSITRPYIEVDPYAAERENNDYTIRSIYFDTKQLDFYYDKIDGLEVRKKVRVRAYNEFLADGSAFLEIKRKYNNNIVKERTQIPYKNIERVCVNLENTNGHLHKWTNDAAVMNRFLYNLRQLNLHPSLLVTYEREAYIGKMDDTLRVTFDKNVRALAAPKLHEMFCEDGFEDVTNGQCILELKFTGFMPKWMRSLVAVLEFRAQSISKYCLGLDACRKSWKDIGEG